MYKKGRGTLNSLEKFSSHNKFEYAIKVSKNNYGYNPEQSLYHPLITPAITTLAMIPEIVASSAPGSVYLVFVTFAGKEWVARMLNPRSLRSGEVIAMSVELSQAHLFDAEGRAFSRI